jgi:hypothetical protein
MKHDDDENEPQKPPQQTHFTHQYVFHSTSNLNDDKPLSAAIASIFCVIDRTGFCKCAGYKG